MTTSQVPNLSSADVELDEEHPSTPQIPKLSSADVEMEQPTRAAPVAARSSNATSGPSGLIKPGNINLTGRPILHNADGSISSEKSFSIGTDEGETLLPLIVNGKELSQQQAIDHYRQTGEHMGIFDTPDHADAYATQVHNRKLTSSGNPVYVYQGDNAAAPQLSPAQAAQIRTAKANIAKYPENQPTTEEPYYDPATGLQVGTTPAGPAMDAEAAQQSIVPQAAVPALQAADKYFVKPRERFVEKAANVGRNLADRALVTPPVEMGTMDPDYRPPITEQEVQEQLKGVPAPIKGAARAVGSTAAGMAADPLMWPFFFSGGAAPTLQKIATAGFAAQMGHGAYEQAGQLGQIIDNPDVPREDKWEAAANLVLSTVMAAQASAHATNYVGMRPDAGAVAQEFNNLPLVDQEAIRARLRQKAPDVAAEVEKAAKGQSAAQSVNPVQLSAKDVEVQTSGTEQKPQSYRLPRGATAAQVEGDVSGRNIKTVTLDNGDTWAFDKRKVNADAVKGYADRGEMWRLEGKKAPPEAEAQARQDISGEEPAPKPEELQRLTAQDVEQEEQRTPNPDYDSNSAKHMDAAMERAKTDKSRPPEGFLPLSNSERQHLTDVLGHGPSEEEEGLMRRRYIGGTAPEEDATQEAIPLGGQQQAHSSPLDELDAPTKGDAVNMPRDLQYDLSLASEEKQWERAVTTPGALVHATRDSLGIGRQGVDGVVIEGAQKPHSLDNATDQVLVEHKGLDGKPVRTWFSAADLSPNPGDSLNAAPESPLDRRTDIATRKRVADMSPDERAKELLTSDTVDLPNKRAFTEAEQSEKSPAVAMSDADGLKAFNDKYGYEAGNTLLRAKAESLKEAGLDSYHDKGDEFLHRGESTGDLKAKLEQARESLRNKEFTVTDTTGRTLTLKGVDFSYGTGADLKTAESGLKTHKADREAAGERARGELRGITEVRHEAAAQSGTAGNEQRSGTAAAGSSAGKTLSNQHPNVIEFKPRPQVYKTSTQGEVHGRVLEFKRKTPPLSTSLSSPHDAIELFGEATALEVQNPKAAMEIYGRLIKENSDPGTTVSSWVNRGVLLYNERKFTEAADSYRKALKLDPHHALAHYNLANALEEGGQRKEAVKHYEQAIKDAPSWADPYYNLGRLQQQLRNNPKALEMYRAFLKRESTGPYADLAHNQIKRLTDYLTVIDGKGKSGGGSKPAELGIVKPIPDVRKSASDEPRERVAARLSKEASPAKQEAPSPAIAQFDEAVNHTGAEVKEGKPSEAFAEKIKEATHLEPANDAELKEKFTGAAYQREYFKAALQTAKDAWIAAPGSDASMFEFLAKGSTQYDEEKAPTGVKSAQLYIKVPGDGHFLVNNTPFAIEKALKGASRGFAAPRASFNPEVKVKKFSAPKATPEAIEKYRKELAEELRSAEGDKSYAESRLKDDKESREKHAQLTDDLNKELKALRAKPNGQREAAVRQEYQEKLRHLPRQLSDSEIKKTKQQIKELSAKIPVLRQNAGDFEGQFPKPEAHPIKGKPTERGSSTGPAMPIPALISSTQGVIKKGSDLYHGAVDKLLDFTHMGKTRPEIRQYDENAADLATKFDASGQYHKALAEMIAKKITDPLTEEFSKSDNYAERARKNEISRDRMKGFHFLADKQNREWVEKNHPDDFKRWSDDPQIAEAVKQYKPFMDQLRDAVKQLGGKVIEDDYIKRVMDFVTSGVAYTEDGKLFTMPKEGRGGGSGGSSSDNIVSPQISRSKARIDDGKVYWDHGVFDFGPSFQKKYVETMSKLDEHRLAVHAMSMGTRIAPGDEAPEKAFYNGQEFYRPDIAKEIREVQKRGVSSESKDLADALGVSELPTPGNVRQYDFYEPLRRGSRFENAARNLAANVLSGKEDLAAQAANVSRMAKLKYALPKEIVEALNDAGREKEEGAVAKKVRQVIGPVTQFIRQQIVGLGYGIPHMANILRKVVQSHPGAALNPMGWADAFKVAFSKELKQAGIKGTEDPTYDMLLRNAAVSEGAIPEYKHYIEGNMDPRNWQELAQTVGNAFKKGGRAAGEVTPLSAAAGLGRLAVEPLNRFSEAGHRKLFKPGGIDQRARVWLARFLQDRFPEMSENSIAHEVNQTLGRYNRASFTDVQKALAPLMLFPGWDYSSIAFALKHPFKTAVAPAVMALLANAAVRSLGANKKDDAKDTQGIHAGKYRIRTNLFNDNMGSHIWGWALRGATAAMQGKNKKDVVGEMARGVPGDVAGVSTGVLNPVLSAPIAVAANRSSPGREDEIVKSGDFEKKGKVLPNKAAEDYTDFAARRMFPIYDHVTQAGQKPSLASFAGLVGVSVNERKKKKR